MGKLRILNTKTGDVKFVEPHIANKTKLMKNYGFILQDLGSEELKPVDKVVVELLNDITVQEPVKRGRKPKQN